LTRVTGQLPLATVCPHCLRRLQHDLQQLAALAGRLDRCLAGLSVTPLLRADAHELAIGLACHAATCAPSSA
jgi:hypothetical protein